MAHHLPSSEVCLFSPQVFHPSCGRKSFIFGDQVEIHLTNWNQIDIPIDIFESSVPFVRNILSTYSKTCCPCVGAASNANLSRKNFFYGTGSLVLACIGFKNLCNLSKLMILLMFVMICLLSSPLSSSLLQISRHLHFVSPVNWLVSSAKCL